MTSKTTPSARWASLGRGRKSPSATRVGFEAPQGLVAHLSEHRGVDFWWSPHIWHGNRRRGEAWESSCAVVIDIDYYDAGGTHAAPPTEALAAPRDAARALGATLFHPTPRGARVVWLLVEAATDKDAWIAAATNLCGLIDAELAETGFRADRAASCDPARIFWGPRATVDDVVRDAEIEVIGEVVDLHDLEPDRRDAGGSSLVDAVEAYRRAHPLDVPRSGGTCPICGHNDCFGRLPTDPHRWHCFSDRHEADGGGVGVRGARGWHGDVLDLHAHRAGTSRVEVLRSSGYLKTSPASDAKPETDSEGPGTPHDPFAGRWLTVDETWTEQVPPEQRWLVIARQCLGLPSIGLLARGVVALIAGAGGIGKTEVVSGLALAIATGGDWLGSYPVDDCAGRVLLLAAEEDEPEMRRRIYRLTRHLSPDERAALRERIVIVPMHARAVAMLARSSKADAPRQTAFFYALRERLLAEAEPDGWAAILIGPLSRLAGVAIDADNENATAIVQALEALTELPGNPTVLVDCHTPATARKRDQTVEDVRPRGPTGLYDGVRWCASMHRPKRGGPIELAIIKSNRGPDDFPVLRLERGVDGVLRCTGQIESDDARREARQREQFAREAKESEDRVDRVVETLEKLFRPNSIPQARETVASRTSGNTAKNRTAFDEAVALGKIVQRGGTAKRPLFVPSGADEECNEGGEETPHTPHARTGRDVPPARSPRSRPSRESDGTGRNGRDASETKAKKAKKTKKAKPRRAARKEKE